jgi:hypothetical protein
MHQRRIIWIGIVICGLLAGAARADTFQLSDGSTLTGDVVSGNENGLQLRLGENSYTNVPWVQFTQDELKKFASDPSLQKFKLSAFVTPFIEITAEERRQKTDVGPLKEVPRLKHPAVSSFFGAMLASPLGFFVLLLLYAAGIYAAYEVAIFRRRPRGLVCGLAAIPGLGFLSPIIFMSLPAYKPPAEAEEVYPAETPAAPAAAPAYTVPGTPATAPAVQSAAAAPGETHGLKLAGTPISGPPPTLPQPQIFQRGAFMFNRRFFETKFPGFFGMVRRDADKDMILQFKAGRGEYIADRISRISANDLHLQVRKGQATEEVMIPFTEIQEVQLKHKDSP